MGMSFGEFLQRQLDERDMSAADLMRKLELTNRTTVSNWVNDKNEPSAEMCRLIAKRLGIDEERVLVEAGHVTEKMKAAVRAGLLAMVGHAAPAPLSKRAQSLARMFDALPRVFQEYAILTLTELFQLSQSLLERSPEKPESIQSGKN